MENIKNRYNTKLVRTAGYISLYIGLFFVHLQGVLAQEQSGFVTGVVLDELNYAVIGASVKVEGTTNGTVTDIDGKFSLNVQENATLLITYIGYNEEKIKIRPDQRNITVRLSVNAQMLQTVEIQVGYGTQAKQTLTGAISQISGDEMITTKSENVQNMLAGRIAGVTVVQKSSEPGDYDNAFEIRGYMDPPLYVIDGIPAAASDFQRLNPNDIESISILKDAAAAVYGVEAANGVVLVTTRTGDGRAKFEFSSNFGMQVPNSLGQTVGLYDWAILQNERGVRGNAINEPFYELTYGEEFFEDLRNGIIKSYDWFSPAIQERSFQHQQNLSVSGSNEKVNYFIGLGYMYQDGFWKTHDLNYDRYNMRTNLSVKLTNRLSTNIRLAGMLDEKEQPSVDSWVVFKTLWSTNPQTPYYVDGDPDYPYLVLDGKNPLVVTNSDIAGYNNISKKTFQGSMDLIYDIPYIKGLQAKGMYSYNYENNVAKVYNKMYTVYNGNKTTPLPANDPETLRRSFTEKRNTVWNISLNYRNRIKNHNVGALLLYEEREAFQDGFYAQRNLGIPVDELYAGVPEGQIGAMSPGTLYEWTKKSLVGRINYDYAQKYLVEASFRYDGSTKFPTNNQWGFFPGVSAGWRIAEETFIKENEALGFIDNIKLRASFGIMGSDNALDYQFVGGYTYPNDKGNGQGMPNGAVFDGNFINSFYIRPEPNPDIFWYEVKTTNVGLDIDLWQGLLGGQFEYFNRYRDGLVETRKLSIPGSYGLDLAQENLNADETSGFEITLTHRNKLNDVRYYVNGNFAYARTMWKKYDRARAGNSYLDWKESTAAGRYNDIVWGYKVIGQFKSYEEIANHPIIQPGSSTSGGNRTLVPGDFIYEDFNGDGVIDEYDMQPIALNRTPKINYGFSIGGDYKGIDFTTNWQGAAMFNVQLRERLLRPFDNSEAALEQFMDRWHPADPNANPFDRTTQWVSGHYPYTGGMNGNYVQNSDFAYTSCAYLRLKSIELGYTLPTLWLEKAGIQRLRVYINAYNLLTFTKLKYVDPEHPEDLYGYRYPLNKTYNIGFNVTF